MGKAYRVKLKWDWRLFAIVFLLSLPGIGQAQAGLSTPMNKPDASGAEQLKTLSQRGMVLLNSCDKAAALAVETKAIEQYQQLLKKGRGDLAGEYAETLSKRAMVYFRRSDFTNALNDCEDASVFQEIFIQHGHGDGTNGIPALLAQKAEVKLALKRFDEAKTDASTAAVSLSGNTNKSETEYAELRNALIVLGMVNENAGDFKTAIAEYLKAEDLAGHILPRGLSTREDLIGLAMERCAQDFLRAGDLASAVKYDHAAVANLKPLLGELPELKNDLVKTLFNLGCMYCMEGKIAEAIPYYSECKAVASDQPEKERLGLALATALIACNRISEAKAMLKNEERSGIDQRCKKRAGQLITDIASDTDVSHKMMQIVKGQSL